jgi:hypothetical protein
VNDSDLIRVLDKGQLTTNTQTKLPRRKLGRGELSLLIALRIYVLVAIPIVGYAFVHALRAQR